jgi:hypothetical protein
MLELTWRGNYDESEICHNKAQIISNRNKAFVLTFEILVPFRGY